MPSGEPEIFHTLQGEGASVGMPTVFLRLATCNLACSWCDTAYTWDWKNFDYKEQVIEVESDVLEKQILKHNRPHIVITGGEPMLQQAELAPLVSSLMSKGFFSEVETNGTIAPNAEMIEAISQWNVSPKLANSGNHPEKREVAQAIEAFRNTERAYFKFVIAEPTDIDEVTGMVERYDIPSERVILMPEGTTVSHIQKSATWLAELCAERGYRFSTRLHILLWGDKRGR